MARNAEREIKAKLLPGALYAAAVVVVDAATVSFVCVCVCAKSFSFFGHFPLDVRVVAEGHQVVVAVVVVVAAACSVYR